MASYSRYDMQPIKRRKRKWPKVLAVIVIVLVALTIAAPSIARTYFKLDYVEHIQQAAEEYQVSPYVIAAMIKCESDYNPNVVSSAGAVGLMQMMPETAQEVAARGLVDSSVYSPNNLYDPETNINYGTAYIRYLVERYHEMNPAIAAYNAGMGNVDKWLQDTDDVRTSIEFEETENYLKRVNRAIFMYQKLYPDTFVWE